MQDSQIIKSLVYKKYFCGCDFMPSLILITCFVARRVCHNIIYNASASDLAKAVRGGALNAIKVESDEICDKNLAGAKSQDGHPKFSLAEPE